MIALQIYFKIDDSKTNAFDDMYDYYYKPALQKQKGYLGSKLLKLYPKEIASEFNATPTEYNYQLELVFDTEENRRLWAISNDHSAVWKLAEFIFEKVKWKGYDIARQDNLY